MTLGKAYDAVMNRVEVTPEMRERVLKRIGEAEITPARPKVLRLPALKRYLSAAACLALVIVGAAVLPRLLGPERQDPPLVQLPPGMEEAQSLQELSGLVGFEVREDFTLPFAVEETEYLAYGTDLAQVTYTGGGLTATYRQSAGEGDNSGDYTPYPSSVELDLDGLAVTLKGEGGAYVLAVWTDGRYSYSVALSTGIAEAEWAAVLDPR